MYMGELNCVLAIDHHHCTPARLTGERIRTRTNSGATQARQLRITSSHNIRMFAIIVKRSATAHVGDYPRIVIERYSRPRVECTGAPAQTETLIVLM